MGQLDATGELLRGVAPEVEDDDLPCARYNADKEGRVSERAKSPQRPD